MAKSNLVIVESPAKAKTIGKYLGPGYEVKASMGHVRDLPKSKLGVDVEHGFELNYQPIKGKEEVIDELKKSAKKSEKVFLATDPDREGEAISWHLKEKVEAGCDFVTTQMFFDNSILYSYLYRIREKGITVPVIAGIMPVTNAKQISRITGMSGTYLPARFKAIVDRFGDNPAAMKQAGIAYATDQIIDLIANGVNGIHVYSMNKPDVAARIRENLSEIL